MAGPRDGDNSGEMVGQMGGDMAGAEGHLNASGSLTCSSAWDPDAPGALPAVKRLNSTEVKWLLWEGVPLLDARSAAEYLRCQIQGAMQVGAQPSEHQLGRLGLDPKAPLICYSNGEQRARQLCAHLEEIGYRCVYLLEAGLEGFLSRQDV